jgi:hypothetical protein
VDRSQSASERELNPSLWGNAAARAEDDTPPDGAIEDYLEWVDRDEELN